jgi:hypothetical protein
MNLAAADGREAAEFVGAGDLNPRSNFGNSVRNLTNL